MTPWELQACVDGWMLANGHKPRGSVSDDELREMGVVGF
jgi:hypothetical protein